jgi:hypothetical protein
LKSFDPWLYRLRFFLIHDIQVDPVFLCPAHQLIQPLQFTFVLGDYQFAALVDLEATGFAIFGERPVAVAGEAGLQAVGGVVESGVQDAAVASTGMFAAVIFFFDQDHLGPVKTFAELAGDTQSHYTTADY